jgi:hypothetical protein
MLYDSVNALLRLHRNKYDDFFEELRRKLRRRLRIFLLSLGASFLMLFISIIIDEELVDTFIALEALIGIAGLAAAFIAIVSFVMLVGGYIAYRYLEYLYEM